MPTQRISGVPEGLPPDELEQWSNELVAFLSSDRVPENFRTWARAQADEVDAYMASAGDLDSAPDTGGSASAVAAPKTPRAPQSRPAAAQAPERTMVLELPEKTGKLILGVLVGLFVLGAVYGIVALTNRGDDNSSVPPSTTGNATAAPFDDAREAQLKALVASDPNNQDALIELGDMNLSADRYTEAVSWYTKLATLDPTNKLAMSSISTANLYLDNPAAAKEWALKLLAIDPNDISAHYNLGYVYASSDPQDLPAAIAEWETVVRLDPTSAEGQTAKTHADGLKAQVTRTAVARGGGTPAPSGTQSAATPPPATAAP